MGTLGGEGLFFALSVTPPPSLSLGERCQKSLIFDGEGVVPALPKGEPSGASALEMAGFCGRFVNRPYVILCRAGLRKRRKASLA